MPGSAINHQVKGRWAFRLLIRLATVVFAVLLYWLLGFIVDDLGNESIGVRAHIIRQARRGRYHLMGVHFSSLSPAHRRMLGQFLQTVRSPHELLAFETAAWS